MAKFKLGAIVTDIIGSIGGTTFKRQGSTMVMMRKSNGASRSQTLLNKRIQTNSQIFKSWRILTVEVQNAWRVVASQVKLPDKFGNARTISAIAFQRKCELAGAVFSFSNIDPTTFTTDLATFALLETTLALNTNIMTVNYNAPTGSIAVAIMLEFSQNQLPAPQFTRRGVVFTFNADGASSFQYDLNENPKFAFLNNNYNIRAYAYTCNPSGWTSPQQFTEVVKLS